MCAFQYECQDCRVADEMQTSSSVGREEQKKENQVVFSLFVAVPAHAKRRRQTAKGKEGVKGMNYAFELLSGLKSDPISFKCLANLAHVYKLDSSSSHTHTSTWWWQRLFIYRYNHYDNSHTCRQEAVCGYTVHDANFDRCSFEQNAFCMYLRI